MAMIDDYEPTIGIECHVQLATATKLFSGADNDARDAAPNTTVSPICFGLPGVLPVLNTQAVQLAIRAGIALNAEVNLFSAFERKHYFYPDLPLGYQITQLERPVIGAGIVEVPLRDGSTFPVRLHHAHLESDAGKLTHPEGADYSLVDLNRAGTPLIEIVSEPDMHTSEQAKAYAQELYLRMVYAKVTHGNLFHGNMRFDVNISIAKKGATELGTRAEIKNLNSFKSVEKVVEYEFKRQCALLEKGETVVQETRGWNEPKQKTFTQRSKEDAHDYRYFPDADLPPIQLTQEEVDAVAKAMAPALPSSIRQRLLAKSVSAKSIATLFLYPLLLDRVLAVEQLSSDDILKQIIDILINVLPPELEKEATPPLPDSGYLPEPAALVTLIKLVNDSTINGSNAKELLRQSWKDLTDPAAIAEKLGFIQDNDEDALAALVDALLADPIAEQSVNDYKAGNQRAMGFFVGQLMKRSGGKANPALAQKIIKQRLG